MKIKFTTSVILAGFLLGNCVLFAQSNNLNDTVAKKETRALENPLSVKGHVSAKAKVEETESKDLFKTKEKLKSFQEEALQDENKAYLNKEIAKQKKNFKKAPKDVLNGLNDTLMAINALQNNKLDEAKIKLNKAAEAFDNALKINPALGLVPVFRSIDINTFEGDIKTIKKALKFVQKALKNHDTQVARSILLPLEDDLIVTTGFIPMDIYPVATKKALKALNNGKKDEALTILLSSLSTIVEDKVVMPIPILSAENLIIKASKLDKSKKDKAEKILKMAQEELEKAVLLGYTKKHEPEYRAIQEEIKGIEKEIKGKNEVEKLYIHLKNSFKSLIGKIRKDVERKKAEKFVNKYEKKEYKKALKKIKTFQKEAVQDEKE